MLSLMSAALQMELQAQTPPGPNKQGHGDRHFSEKGKGLYRF